MVFYYELNLLVAELLGKMRLVSGCLTYVNSQRSQFANMYSIPYSRCYARFFS